MMEVFLGRHFTNIGNYVFNSEQQHLTEQSPMYCTRGEN